MPTFGSDGGFRSDTRGGVIDQDGNSVISADTTFGASPLGAAPLGQVLFGIANPNFNILPPDPASPIVQNQNELPYWLIEINSDTMTATSKFDATTQTWGVELNTGAAASGDTMILSSRSYVLTDDNLSLRQKAFAVLSKSGTAAASTQWNLTLSASYYDVADNLLSTYVIGTVYDTGTWTGISGSTTSGGVAINAAAHYVDLAFTLTATAAVTGSAKATIKSLLVADSSAATNSFVIAQTFTTSGTWTRPVGVEYLTAMMGVGGGGGGGGGSLYSDGTAALAGGGGGGGGLFAFGRDIYVGDLSSISIGIGAGGSGGAARTFNKASGSNTTTSQTGAVGSVGGSTTIGTLATIGGGNFGAGGKSSGTVNGGSQTTSLTTIVWGFSTTANGQAGGDGGQRISQPAGNGGSSGLGGTLRIAYAPPSLAGSSGASAAGTGGTATQTGAAGTTTSTGFSGGGGGGAGCIGTEATGGGTGNTGGGGGGGCILVNGGANTVTRNGGAGGNAATNSGGGGGGGGGLALTNSSSTGIYTLSSGKGGDGASGFVTLVYVA